jgi:hypothetical protein
MCELEQVKEVYMPVNINFVVLRECQAALVAEAAWMGKEIEAFTIAQEDERPHVVEARKLVLALRNVGGAYLNEEIAALKSIALAQRAATKGGPEPQTVILRLLNGLHASVAAMNGQIAEVSDTSIDLRLAILLRSGMVGFFRAIEGIGEQLRPLLLKDADQQATSRLLKKA